MTRIVCDTGPLLHLHEADALGALQALGEVFIPPAVHRELLALDPRGELKPRIRWAQVEQLLSLSLAAALTWQQEDLLDPGEAEAMALTKQLGADWFLTDDAAARLVAEREGIEAHGSVGVVLRAAVIGYLNHETAHQAWQGLVRSSLWLSHRVKKEAEAALSQLFPGPGGQG